jgi:hypothetical protein
MIALATQDFLEVIVQKIPTDVAMSVETRGCVMLHTALACAELGTLAATVNGWTAENG